MGDAMESLDDIIKQMNKQSQGAQIADSATQSVLEPRVVQQKEDLLYIKNPGMDWSFNGIVKLEGHDVMALTVSLQEQQAIALLL